MAASPHYRDLLRVFNDLEVEYLVVGGYAVMKYTEPRFTKDLDVWVRNSAENSLRLYRALGAFGAPLANDGVTPDTFTGANVVYQIGLAPVRIDIMTHITGLEFSDAWPNRVGGTFSGVPVNFISLDDLIANKRAAGRTTDLADLERFK